MKVTCIRNNGYCQFTKKNENFDLTIGDEYTVVKKFEADGGIKYYELESDDCGVPCVEFEQSMFEPIYDLNFCDTCLQMTNHIDDKCQKHKI